MTSLTKYLINKYSLSSEKAIKVEKEYNELCIMCTHNYTIDEFMKIITEDFENFISIGNENNKNYKN